MRFELSLATIVASAVVVSGCKPNCDELYDDASKAQEVYQKSADSHCTLIGVGSTKSFTCPDWVDRLRADRDRKDTEYHANCPRLYNP